MKCGQNFAGAPCKTAEKFSAETFMSEIREVVRDFLHIDTRDLIKLENEYKII